MWYYKTKATLLGRTKIILCFINLAGSLFPNLKQKFKSHDHCNVIEM